MGNNRRNKGGPFNSSSHRSKSTSVIEGDALPPGNEDEWTEALHQVQVDALKMGWKECLTFNLAILLLATLSVCIGIAGGISISLCYWEEGAESSEEWPLVLSLFTLFRYPSLALASWLEPVDLYYRRGRSIPEAPPQRITLADPFVASSNSLTGHRDGLGRILQSTTVPGLRNSALQLVEETAPLSDAPSLVNLIHPPKMDFFQLAQTLPHLCSDGKTMGYDTWGALKRAVQEANAFEAELFVRWNEYFALTNDSTGSFDDPAMYYQQAIVLRICPGTELRSRQGPIFINAENLIIDCPTIDCRIAARGSHFSFGPRARNVMIRGFTFTAAHTSSLVLYHDGAEVTLEDCRWIDNTAIHAKVGCVADVNSTSVVNFYRCHIGKLPSMQPGFISSLSIRQ